MTEKSRLVIASEGGVAQVRQLAEVVTSAPDFVAKAVELLRDPENHHVTSIEVPPVPRMDDVARPDRDAEAAIRVYEWIGSLPRAVASQGRLWTAMVFLYLPDYMQERWSLTAPQPEAGTRASWSGRAKDRWTMARGTRSTLVRHGVARLWWGAHVTREPSFEMPLSESGDQWAYTRVLFSKTDRHLQIADRDAGMLEAVLWPVLEHIAEDAARATASHVRELMKEIVLVGGYRELASLTLDDAREVVAEIASRV